MKTLRSLTILACTLGQIVFALGQAFGDPLPGEILKFQQLPLNNGAPVINPYLGPFINPNPFPLVAPPTPTAPFPGHDETSTAYANLFDTNGNAIGWQGQFMADDFADRFTSSVVHVRWWGSYQNNQVFTGVKRFLISFESDVPVSPNNPFSHPGTPLLNQIVTLGPLAPASGTFTEALLSPPGPTQPEALFQYNAELNLGKDFKQQPNTVYWLKIVALVDANREGNIVWGWHNRDWSVPDLLASIPPAVVPGEGNIAAPGLPPIWHFQDDAVSGTVGIFPGSSPIMPDIQQGGYLPHNYIAGLDGPTYIEQYSKDLAFELYTVPEPASLVLIGFGAAGVAFLRKRKHSQR